MKIVYSLIFAIIILITASCSDNPGSSPKPENNFYAIAKDACYFYVTYNKSSAQEAIDTAKTRLFGMGSKTPTIWKSGENIGWAAFAYSYNADSTCSWGFVWNQKTETDAKNSALIQCTESGGKNPYIVSVWKD